MSSPFSLFFESYKYNLVCPHPFISREFCFGLNNIPFNSQLFFPPLPPNSLLTTYNDQLFHSDSTIVYPKWKSHVFTLFPTRRVQKSYHFRNVLVWLRSSSFLFSLSIFPIQYSSVCEAREATRERVNSFSLLLTDILESEEEWGAGCWARVRKREVECFMKCHFLCFCCWGGDGESVELCSSASDWSLLFRWGSCETRSMSFSILIFVCLNRKAAAASKGAECGGNGFWKEEKLKNPFFLISSEHPQLLLSSRVEKTLEAWRWGRVSW